MAKHLFRTPHRCQNKHFIWLFWEAKAGEVINSRWGERHAACKCPTHEFGEGFAPCGPDQRFTGLVDRRYVPIYEGDTVQRYPLHKYTAFLVEWSRDEGWRLPSSEPASTIMIDFQVTGNLYE